MERTNNPFENLDIKYPEARYGDGSIKQKAFFEQGSYESNSIPLEERIEILARFIFEGYDIHKLVNDYLDEKDALDDDRRKHDIAFTFNAYSFNLLHSIEETKKAEQFSDNLKQLMQKYYDDSPSLHKKETSSEEMQRRIDEFVNLVKETHNEKKFVEQTQKPDNPIFLIRANYFDKDANDVEKLINDLYENNIVSINVRDKYGSDDDYCCNLFNRKIEKQDTKKMYINRFYQLYNEIQKNDVIVIAHYLGKNSKIGLIKNKSKVFCKEEAGEIYKLYCLKMENVKDIDINKYPLLKSIIPQQITISPVNKRRNVINNIYSGSPIPFELSSLSESDIEIMCMEYLRSRFAETDLQISFQLMRTGGNMPDIDIIGYNKHNNELVMAQVSYTSDIKLINKKKLKLEKQKLGVRKVMFSMLPYKKDEIQNINIQDVWNDFEKDELYKKFLEQLIEL